DEDRVIDWLGIKAFIIFSLLFLIMPTLYLVVGALLTPEGDFTLKNIGDIFTPSIMSDYWISIRISVASALGGALIGFFLA
ncbi:acriflavin resistance protein, partial [Rhizobium leguminosarum]